MITKAIKYQAIRFSKAMMIYYTVMLLVLSLLVYLVTIFPTKVEVNLTGMESVTTFLIFVLASDTCKENFKMFIQNGVSRKTVFFSYIITVTGVATLATVISKISATMISSYFSYESSFQGLKYMGNNALLRFMDGFFWTFSSYIMAAAVGYFLAILFYRMGKKLSMLVFIGVLVLFTFFMIFAAHSNVSATILEQMATFFTYIRDLKRVCNAYFIEIADIIIFSALSYGLLRGAIVKTT